MTHFELRMARVLREIAESSSYLALARAISAANDIPEGEKDAIDRRKLRRIVDHDLELVLSMPELHALDRFLEPRGEGLAFNSFFYRPNVLQSLADADHSVTFLLGAKQVGGYNLDLSQWDVKALTEVLRGVNKYRRDVLFDIRDVLLHDEVEDAERAITSPAWNSLLGEKGPSIVCLGSMRAAHPAERLLSKMHKLAPLRQDADKASLPFSFYWPAGIPHLLPSAFRMDEAELEAFDPTAAREVFQAKASALRFDGQVYLDNLNQTRKGKTYAICVAQRRPAGQIWLVLAGITGPATFAAALVAKDLALAFNEGGHGEASPVYCTAVQAHAQLAKSNPIGPLMDVTRPEILGGTISSGGWGL